MEENISWESSEEAEAADSVMRSIRLFAKHASKIARFHSSQSLEDQSTAESAIAKERIRINFSFDFLLS